MRLPLGFKAPLFRLQSRRSSQLLPARLRYAWRPRIRRLEPRVVLNATAELNALGQLVIHGTDTADQIQFDINQQQQIELRDARGIIVPITVANGQPVDSLNIDQLTSGQVIVDLKAGNDVLNVELPAALQLSVLQSDGVDSTAVTMIPGSTIITRSLQVDSESIFLRAQNNRVDLSSVDADLNGQVFVGNLNAATELKLDNASVVIAGQFTLQGDVQVTGRHSRLDLSGADLSATLGLASLDIQLGADADSVLRFGNANQAAGHFVNDFQVSQTTAIEFVGSTFTVAGDFVIQSPGQALHVDTEIAASSITLDAAAESLRVEGPLTALSGALTLSSLDSIEVTADLSSDDHLTIQSQRVLLQGVDLRSANGNLEIDGDLQIRGAVTLQASDGDVRIQDRIDAADDTLTTLSIVALDAGDGGNLFIGANIGERIGLDGLLLRSSLATVENIRLRSGDLTISTDTTVFHGERLQTVGRVEVQGTLQLQQLQSEWQAESFAFSGPVRGQGSGQNLNIQATNTVHFAGEIGGLAALRMDVVNLVSLAGNVQLAGDLLITAEEIQISATQVTTDGTQSYDGRLRVLQDARFAASQFELHDALIVDAAAIATIEAAEITRSVAKQGLGTLVIAETASVSAAVTLNQGSLVFDGTLRGEQNRLQVIEGRLSGRGTIDGTLRLEAGASMSPGIGLGQLTVGQYQASEGSQFQLQIGGNTSDRIIVSTPSDVSNITLSGQRLELDFVTDATIATEYIVVANDGLDVIQGRFHAAFSAQGTPLSTARELKEGDLVLENFGNSGRAAYITYFGGDGNDVAIVTAGDVEVTAGDVTLIQRQGSNLEIRTGNDLASAQAAVPVIRPIAAVNDHRVQIIGSANDQSLFIDLHDLVAPSPAAIQFTGEITFADTSRNDRDLITLIDLTQPTSTLLDDVSITFTGTRTGAATVTTQAGQSVFEVSFTGVETFHQAALSEFLSLQYQLVSETVVLSETTGVHTLSATMGGETQTEVLFVSPSEQLAVHLGAGDDSFTLTETSTTDPLESSLKIDGEEGSDRVSLERDLRLGAVSSAVALELSAEQITLSGSIQTASGTADKSVRLVGGDFIVIDASSRVDVGTATLGIDANGGTFDSGSALLISQNTGDAIRIDRATQIRLGDVEASQGRLTLQADQGIGDVTQSQASTLLVQRLNGIASGLVTLNNAGNDFQHIESLIAPGAVSLRDDGGNLQLTRLISQRDVTLVTTGDLLLDRNAIIANDAHIDLRVGSSLLDSQVDRQDQASPHLQAATANLRVAGATIGSDETPLVVDLTRQLDASTTTAQSQIHLRSPRLALPIGQVHAENGLVRLSGQSIQDATEDEQADIRARTVSLQAESGIGSVRKLELQSVSQLTAATQTGGIKLDHTSSAAIQVESLVAMAGDITFRHSSPDELLIQHISSGGGTVVVQSLASSLRIASRELEPTITVASPGTLTLNAFGTSSQITLQGNLQTSAGDIDLRADQAITLQSNVSVRANGGDIRMLADAATETARGGITMAAGSLVDAAEGSVHIVANADILIASIVSTATVDDAIQIHSRFASIEGNAQATHLSANAGGAILQAATGIGVTRPLQTRLMALSANVSQSGPLAVEETDAIELRDVLTADGPIDISANGTIHVTAVVSQNQSGRDNSAPAALGHGDVTILARGEGSDIRIQRLSARNGADVRLDAGDDILHLGANDDLLDADDLDLIARNGTDDAGHAVDLRTDVNQLTLMTLGRFAGDVQITELNSFELANSDFGGDNDRLVLSNGGLQITAANQIVVRDANPQNDSATRRADVEIVVGGDRGMIRMSAGERIELAGATQIEASRALQGSISLEAPAIAFGDQIQLLTADGEGIARWFTRRPMTGLADTAFFDFTTVQTNRLAQSGVNDAIGILSLLIGQPGENGLVINIDWGDSTDPSRRFQEIKSLLGDRLFQQSHEFLESDILSSVLNDRDSATDPLEVRFSVRHHDSIIVRGDTIKQGDEPEESVSGRLISSTDNPTTTSLFENGTAQFVIPNLTIPVAFFPVRQIIPDPIEPETFIRVETQVFVSASRVESQTTSVSSSTSREEYFQLRVLSPDPAATELAAPIRLPDDILSGDKLKRLLNQLPDGRYEVEYTMGDGNSSTLLRFDLRDHEPIVPSDNLDGSPLQLQPISPEEIQRELREAQQERNAPGDIPSSQSPQAGLPVERDESTTANLPLDGTVATAALSGWMLSRIGRRSHCSTLVEPLSKAGRFIHRRSRAARSSQES